MSYSPLKLSGILLGILLFPFILSAQVTKKVMIIGIDGCRSDALIQANTPNLDELIANGVFSPDALNIEVTSSGPGWSAILTGVWSDKHGVTDNSFAGSNYQEYPSLFARVENHNFDLHTVSFCHWNPINDQIIQDEADFRLNLSTDAEVAAQAVDYLSVNDPDLLFLHFDDVDHAGHSQGFSPDVPAYLASIEQTDI